MESVTTPARSSSSRSPLSLLPRPWRFAQRAAQALATVVGVFWIGFAGIVATSEGWVAFWPAISIIAPLAAVVVATWIWPRAAGPILLGAAGLAAWRFDHAAPRTLMSLPMGAAGLTLVACVWRTLVRPR